jgi:hypothetical protein
VQVSEALSPAHQWGTFEELLKRIHDGDELIFDMTHGFRAVAVVFSSAMHFLRLTRNIKLRHVFYGAHDSDPPEIVDYRNFYAVQDWTEAVSRLVDDADASKLAALATMGPISGRYDAQYFAVQRELIGLLLQHGLAMQAYTAMSEYLSSIGLHSASRMRSRAVPGRDPDAKQIRNRADAFGAMICNKRARWEFDGEAQPLVAELLPWYEVLEGLQLVKGLRKLAGKIRETRNGFNHGWTAVERDGKKVIANGLKHLSELGNMSGLVDRLAVSESAAGEGVLGVTIMP